MTVEDVAVEVAHDEVVEPHLEVVEAARREHRIAVGQTRGEVARGSLHESAAQHLLRGPEHLLLGFLRGERGRGHDRTSGFTRLDGRPPARSEAMPSAMSVEWLVSVSYVAPPMCGVSTTLSIEHRGWSGGRCSPTKWSRPAPASLPDCSAITSASVSWSNARALLMKIAPSFILANCAAPMRCSVSGVTTACSDTTSAMVSRSSSECVASGEYGSEAMTVMPRPSNRH